MPTLVSGYNAPMFVHSLLLLQFLTLLILAILHIFGITGFLYQKFLWLDIVTHFLGGLWAGFFAAWVLSLWGKRQQILFCVSIALTLGILWELFEVMTGLTIFPEDSLDTVKDLLMDTAGGIFAGLVSIRFFRP